MKSYLFLKLIVIINFFPVVANGQYIWPVNPDDIDTISSEYQADIISAVLGVEGNIFSVTSGRVLLVRETGAIYGLPGIIVLRTDDNILITYLYTNPEVDIGDKVYAGDVLGSVQLNNTLYFCMYDVAYDRYIDPFFVLPNLKRDIKILLTHMLFIYENPLQTISLNKHIRSGSAKIALELHITDSKSKGMIMPETIWINIGDEELQLTKDQLSQQIVNASSYLFDSETVDTLQNSHTNNQEEEQKLTFIVPHVEIPIGYFDILIRINTVFGGNRTIRFNVFAN